MPDENRVFDVSKPGRHAPQPSGKPVIVGHRPTISDPMVKDEANPMDFGTEAKPTKISITDENGGEKSDHDIHDLGSHHDLGLSSPAASWEQPEQPKHDNFAGPELPSDVTGQPPDHEDTAPAVIHEPAKPAETPSPSPSLPETPEPEAPPPTDTHEAAAPADMPPPSEPLHGVEALHFQPERRRGGRGKYIVLGVLALIIAVYLAIDAGLIASGVNLPFHIFKQKDKAPVATEQPPAQPNPPAPTTPSLPAGFTQYTLSGTDISFAAPTAWGQPSSATENGYSSRSAGAKSDGTYAYLVSFATNKDIQIAVTSGKYLPPARDATYYDHLQWCTGTNDGKIYDSVLHFTTANGVDTPTTISCDQGPLTGATKLDDSTIVQPNIKDAKNNPLGDVYTKNLNEKALPVLRVKDTTMKNSADIKTLLGTVKTTGTASQ